MDGEPAVCDAATIDAIDTSVAPMLVIGVGNPRRGDDALAPLLLQRLAESDLTGVELIGDVALQAEHVLDILGRRDVVFVAASSDAAEPFEFAPTKPHCDASVTTHALSPSAVLDMCVHLGAAVPPAHALAIRGYAFDAGAALSARAAQNLDAAAALLTAHLRACVLTSAE